VTEYNASRNTFPTRREFLQTTAKALGASAVDWPRRLLPSAPHADMAIAAWDGLARHGESAPDELKAVAERLTEAAVENLGGMRRFVHRGDVVWIKPNMGFRRRPEFAVTTNPDVLAALVRLCLDAGAKRVCIGDHAARGWPGAHTCRRIEEAVKAVDGEMMALDGGRFKNVGLAGQRLSVWPLYRDMVEADLLINVPVAKQHSLTRISVCMNNLMGVAGGPRYLWHSDMPRCLTDVAAYVRPRLTVVDAVRVLTRGGPAGGALDDVTVKGIVAAGHDMVALEAFGAELLGCDPAQSRTMALAQERGLGRIDYRNMALREVKVA